MTKRTSRYTDAEISLAKNLYEKARKAGTLKAPRVIAAVALSTGHRSTVIASEVTHRDYLRDARRLLAAG